MTAPVRTCVVCRRKSAQSDFVRIRWSDTAGRLTIGVSGHGRSAYTCNELSCRLAVFEKGRIERGIRRILVKDDLTALKSILLSDED